MLLAMPHLSRLDLRNMDFAARELLSRDGGYETDSMKFFRLWSVTVELVAALCS